MMDGSVLRLPRMRITAIDGSELEMKPRPVDVPVTCACGESAQGRDSQIETAVKELLRHYQIVIRRRKLSGFEIGARFEFSETGLSG